MEDAVIKARGGSEAHDPSEAQIQVINGGDMMVRRGEMVAMMGPSW